jgi:hypothetical protein
MGKWPEPTHIHVDPLIYHPKEEKRRENKMKRQ